MTISTSNFSADLLPIVKKWFGDTAPNLPSIYDKIFTVEKADSRAYEVDAMVSPLSTLQVKEESNALTFDISKQMYTPRYTHTTYSLGFRITLEMMEDGDAMKNAKRFTEQLKLSAVRTREVISAAVLNNAFTSGYTQAGGDGSILCVSSHAARSGTQSNVLATAADLSEASLEQALIDIRNTKNDRGDRINVQAVKLVVPAALEFEAHRILNSPLRVTTADNDLNAVKTLGKVSGGIVVNPYLTDSDAWFLVTDAPDGLKFKNRKDPEIDSDNEFHTKDALFSVLMRCSVGWSDFRGVYGTPGA